MKYRDKILLLTDEELLRNFSESNDMLYFGELYKRYVPKTYGLCLKYLGEKEKAQDAVMDIFHKLTTTVQQYDVENFGTWLYSVAKNHCLQLIRKENQTKFIKIEDAFVENDEFFTLTDKQKPEEELNALEYCMGTLPEEQRLSIRMFFYEEQSYADIVETTGYQLSKVKSYIQNGKRNLRICVLKVLQKG